MIADEPQTELALLARQLEELNQIGAALAAERDTGRLLDLILTKAREITSSDAGSLYLVEAVAPPAASHQAPATEDGEEQKLLRFAIAQNASISVPFRTTTLEITDTSIRQTIVHDRQLGRVNATVRVAVLMAQLAATLAAGFLALQLGLRVMLFLGPTIGLLGVLAVWFSPLRRVRRIEDLAPSD